MIQETKICAKCKKKYPATLEYFYLNKHAKDKLNSWCKKCHNKESKKKKDEKSGKNIKIRNKKYHEKNKEKINERSRNAYHDFKKNYPEEHKKRIHKYLLKTRYGITREEYDQFLEEQDNVCAICGCKETSKFKSRIRELSVDHNHKTGKIRGLLCHNCNNILGRAKDNPLILMKCIKYLE